MNNMDLYNSIREVPMTAQKPIKGGRLNNMTDINPMWRIQTLTEQFGPAGFGWYYEIKNKWIEEGSDGEKCAFVDIKLYVKEDNKWSEPIEGTGGSKFVAKEKNGLYTSDEAYKMALTDALSVSCKALGMGANIYWATGRTKHSQTNNEQPNKTDDKISEDKLKELQAYLAVYPKENRTAVLTLLLKPFKVKQLSDLTNSQFIKFRSDLLPKAKDMMLQRFENMIKVFADKTGNSEHDAKGMIEISIGKDISDILLPEFNTYAKKICDMIKGTDDEQADI